MQRIRSSVLNHEQLCTAGTPIGSSPIVHGGLAFARNIFHGTEVWEIRSARKGKMIFLESARGINFVGCNNTFRSTLSIHTPPAQWKRIKKPRFRDETGWPERRYWALQSTQSFRPPGIPSTILQKRFCSATATPERVRTISSARSRQPVAEIERCSKIRKKTCNWLL
jgi:hypothetical protein